MMMMRVREVHRETETETETRGKGITNRINKRRMELSVLCRVMLCADIKVDVLVFLFSCSRMKSKAHFLSFRQQS